MDGAGHRQAAGALEQPARPRSTRLPDAVAVGGAAFGEQNVVAGAGEVAGADAARRTPADHHHRVRHGSAQQSEVALDLDEQLLLALLRDHTQPAGPLDQLTVRAHAADPRRSGTVLLRGQVGPL